MKKRNNNGKQSYILTRETLGMTIMLFCFVVAVMLLTHRAVFAGLGGAICTFMYGTFGYGSYLVLGALGCLGFWLTFEKFPKLKAVEVAVIAAVVLSAFLLFHAVSTRDFALDGFGEYLADCYNNAQAGYSGYTFGGVVSGILVYPIAKGTTFIGAYVIFSLILAACAYLTFLVIRRRVLADRVAKGATVKDAPDVVREEDEEKSADKMYALNENYEIVKNDVQGDVKEVKGEIPPERKEPEGKSEEELQADRGRKILFEPGEFAAESYRRNLIFNENSYFNHPVRNDDDYLRSFSNGDKPKENETPPPQATYTSDYSREVESSAEQSPTPSYIYGEKPAENLSDDFAEEQPYERYTVSSDRSEYSGEQPDSAFGQESDGESEEISPAAEQPEIPPRRTDFGERENFADTMRTPADRGEMFDRTDRADRGEMFDRSDRTDRSEMFDRSENGDTDSDSIPERGDNIFGVFGEGERQQTERGAEENSESFDSTRRSRSRENIFDDDDDDDNLFGETGSLAGGSQVGRRGESFGESGVPERRDSARGFETSSESESTPVRGEQRGEIIPPVSPIRGQAPAAFAQEKKEQTPAPAPAPEKPKHVWKKYIRPTLDLLDDYPENNNVNTAEIEESKRVICETLASFHIASQVSNVVVGPAITRYDVIIEDKTNIKNALKYREAVAMALMKENVNAYLNYSKGAISIEVPNSKRAVVGLKSMLASSQFINCKPNTLTFALGKNVEGQVVCPDITKMPHLLVAGTTGSGKSICLSALIVSLLYKYGPEELRFILVDPKQVEFISYDKLPHLMINEIIYDVDKAIKALNWAIKEMEDRYAKFKEMTEKGVATKNLTEYNAHLPEGEEKLPKIVIILDEFGDLMLQAKKEIESRIIRLVQKARACGIHLILATQRPSVDCITGLIKSNLPTRIGFKVNSFDDARCIFDIGGAEKLLGKGDLYYRSAENPELARVQGCFIDTHEVQKVTDFVKENNETFFDQTVSDFINTVEEPEETASDDGGAAGAETKIDDTFIKALKFCVTSNQASVSMIQRRFPIGYMKACKIIDWMENMNYITQSEGSKPRKVLLSREEFIRIFGDVDD